jgi:hypothetical protein
MKPSFKSTITAATVAGVISAVFNSILYFIFHATGVIPDNVYVQENQPLTLLPVLLSSFVPSLLAGVVFYLFCRYAKNGLPVLFHSCYCPARSVFCQSVYGYKKYSSDDGYCTKYHARSCSNLLLYFLNEQMQLACCR